MDQSKFLLLFRFVALVVLGAYFYSYRLTTSVAPLTPPVLMNNDRIVSPTLATQPFTATFRIYTNGTRRTFTQQMYHRLSPDAYITVETPETVQVTRSDISWQQFFNTLPFSLTEECLVTGSRQTFCTNDQQQLSFYLNGKLRPDALQLHIAPNDTLLVTFGPKEDSNIENQLTDFK